MMKWTMLLAMIAALASGCSSGAPRQATGQAACDDGGSGGVLIDGVCL